jgi:D-lactate dehydrogenase (cytochrome)
MTTVSLSQPLLPSNQSLIFWRPVMRATNIYGSSAHKWPEKDSLYFKFQGPTRASLEESARIAKQIVEKHGGSGFKLAANDQEAADLWEDRKNGLYSSLALVPGSRGWSTDVWWVLNAVQVTGADA